MNVESVSIEELIPYANNAKTHPAEQVEMIAASIREFGFNNPILTDGENGIVAGHGRLQAAKKLKLEAVPVIRLEHLSEAQKKAYILADNRLGEVGGTDWDMDLVSLELEQLQELDFDVDLTGFSIDDILVDEVAGLTDEDSVPEVEDNPITVEGDVWLLGEHRLMCGDSTSIDAVETLMDGFKPHAVVTDPPYGIGIDGQKESKSANPKHNRKAHEFRGWDNERPDAGIFNYIVALNCPAVIWGGNYFADLLPPTRGWIYWSKGQDGLTMSDGELAWTTENKPLRSKTVNRAALQGSAHPTQKPLDIMIYSMDYVSTPEKGAVLDLFGGSGSTLIACEKTNRNAFLMELDPKYCDVIIRRWQDYTGKQAVHEATGVIFDNIIKTEAA